MGTSKLQLLNKVISLCKKRGFIFQALQSVDGGEKRYTYGPLGAELKRNLINEWWVYHCMYMFAHWAMHARVPRAHAQCLCVQPGTRSESLDVYLQCRCSASIHVHAWQLLESYIVLKCPMRREAFWQRDGGWGSDMNLAHLMCIAIELKLEILQVTITLVMFVLYPIQLCLIPCVT